MALSKEEIIITVFKALTIQQPAVEKSNTNPLPPTHADQDNKDDQSQPVQNVADELTEIPVEDETSNHTTIKSTLNVSFMNQQLKDNHIISNTVGIIIDYAQQQYAQHNFPKTSRSQNSDLSFLTIRPLIDAFSQVHLTNAQWAEICQRDYALHVNENEARAAYIASTLVTIALCFNFNCAEPNKITISNNLFRNMGIHTTASDSIIGQINNNIFQKTCDYLVQHENTLWAKSYLCYIKDSKLIPVTLAPTTLAKLSAYDNLIWQAICSNDTTAIPITIKAFLLVNRCMKDSVNNVPILRVADLLEQITPEHHVVPALWLPLNLLASNYRNACSQILTSQGVTIKNPQSFLNSGIYSLIYSNQFRSLLPAEIIRQAIKWNSKHFLCFQDYNSLAFLAIIAYECNNIEAQESLKNCLPLLTENFGKLSLAIQNRESLAELFTQRISKINKKYQNDFITKSQVITDTATKYRKYTTLGYRELYKIGRFFQKEANKLNEQVRQSQLYSVKSKYGDPAKERTGKQAASYLETGKQFVAAAEKKLIEIRM
jgi:hypothetical protein